MIKLNGKGCWLLANYSRNMVSTYTTKQLVNELQQLGCTELNINKGYALLTLKNLSEKNHTKICTILQNNKNVTMPSNEVIRYNFDTNLEPHTCIGLLQNFIFLN